MVLFLLLILTVIPYWSASAKHSARSIPEGSNVNRPFSIATTGSEYGTTVNNRTHAADILGTRFRTIGNKMNDYRKTMKSL